MKKAVTYYHDLTSGYSDIVIHRSGTEALKYFLENAQKYFNLPILWKHKPKLPMAVRVGLRSYNCRFVEDLDGDFKRRIEEAIELNPKEE